MIKVETKQISELIPYGQNARVHTRSQIDLIKKSITKFGFIVPVLIDDKNIIITGHGRVKAAEQLGITEIPTIQINHLTDDQIKAFRVADNYLTDESKWDKDLLKLEFSAFNLSEFDLLRGLGLNLKSTDIKLDHRVDETDNSGGAYFQTANEIFIQIGSVNFTIDQNDDIKKGLEKLRSMKQEERKEFGNLIFQTLNNIHETNGQSDQE